MVQPSLQSKSAGTKRPSLIQAHPLPRSVYGSFYQWCPRRSAGDVPYIRGKDSRGTSEKKVENLPPVEHPVTVRFDRHLRRLIRAKNGQKEKEAALQNSPL